MKNKNIENFLIKYPKVKQAILYCFENDKNYGWFVHYKDDKKLGAKPNKISKPTSILGANKICKYEWNGNFGFHEIWVYLKNNWLRDQI